MKTKQSRDNILVHSKFTSGLTTNVAPGNVNGFAAFFTMPTVYGNEDPVAIILKNYQNYRVRTMTAQWNPNVGSTVPGTIYMAYFDNPEFLANLARGVYSTNDIGNLVRTSPDHVSGPVWMPLRYTPRTLTRARRTMFATNSTLPDQPPSTPTVTEVYAYRSQIDLTVQGVIISYVEAATNADEVAMKYGSTTFDHTTDGYFMYNNAYAGV